MSTCSLSGNTLTATSGNLNLSSPTGTINLLNGVNIYGTISNQTVSPTGLKISNASSIILSVSNSIYLTATNSIILTFGSGSTQINTNNNGTVTTNYVAPYNTNGLGIINQTALANIIPSFQYIINGGVTPQTVTFYNSNPLFTRVTVNGGNNPQMYNLNFPVPGVYLVSIMDPGETQGAVATVWVGINNITTVSLSYDGVPLGPPPYYLINPGGTSYSITGQTSTTTPYVSVTCVNNSNTGSYLSIVVLAYI
jgi:hypothetical protein